MAASAVVLVFYLDRFIPGAADPTPFLVVPLPVVPLTFSRQSMIAVAAIALMALVHLRGVGPGRLVSNTLATLKVGALLLFIALGFSIGAGSSANLQQSAGSVAAGGWLLALVPLMFTYSGWNAAAYMAEEIREPGRNVPRALALGTAAVVGIYVCLNLLYLYVMPIGELARVEGSVLDVVAERLLGGRAGDIMGVVSIVSLTASISAYTFAGPRVYYAMARDGLFFCRHRRPGGVGIPPRADRQRRDADHVHRICGRVVLRGGGGRAVRAALARTRGAASVPDVGLPCGSRLLCLGQPGDCGQCALDRPGGSPRGREVSRSLGRRPGGDCGRLALVSLDAAAMTPAPQGRRSSSPLYVMVRPGRIRMSKVSGS
jgi:hypothetical protein